MVRYGILGANFALIAVVAMFVVDVRKSDNSVISSSVQSQSIFQVEESKPLDSLSSADVAVHVARLTGLQEAVAVVNKADTVNAQLAVASSDDSVVVKPQIIGAGLKSKKDIKIYVSLENDTIASLAEKFGVNQDTIRISNNLAGNVINAGTELLISPVNGIVHRVKAGDTPDSVANKYQANKQNIIAFNDAEVTGAFVLGELIVIPDGIIPAVAVVARSSNSFSYSGFAFGTSAIYNSNGYDYGWCTWHAANRRKEIGRPIPSNLGNAISWLSVARRAGLGTGDVPLAGAVLYQKNLGGLGHVAFVEKVNDDDGSILVSDMNYPIWGRVTYRTVGPGEFGNYSFIY